MKALFFLITLLVASCATFQRDKLRGGSVDEQKMVHGAFNRQITYLQSKGYKFPDKRDKVKLYPVDPVKVVKLRSGRKQGVMENNDGKLVAGRAGAYWIKYARPATPEMFDHEVKHCLLAWGGYHEDSRTHNRKAFPEGGIIK